MITTDNINYIADEGKIFQRKSDGFLMGKGLSLGKSDLIDNYLEIDTPEDYVDPDERHRKKKHNKEAEN